MKEIGLELWFFDETLTETFYWKHLAPVDGSLNIFYSNFKHKHYFQANFSPWNFKTIVGAGPKEFLESGSNGARWMDWTRL